MCSLSPICLSVLVGELFPQVLAKTSKASFSLKVFLSVGAVQIKDNTRLRVSISGNSASGSIEVLSSQNGGIFGQFQDIEVVVEGCSASAIGSPLYQQYSLSVAFQLQGDLCSGLSRSALIGVIVGAAIGGIVFAVVVVLVIKAATANYTRHANMRIRDQYAEDLAQPLLNKMK